MTTSRRKKIKKHQQDAFEKWLSYWQTTCDWKAFPEPWEAWNGAIDLVSKYLADGFCEDEFFDSIPKMDKVVKKLQRFKAKMDRIR